MAEEELYLIAHKVRGERAFDIASPLKVGAELWWIIPTSGHRAYPYWIVPLDSLTNFDSGLFPMMPEDLPDHYRVCRKQAEGEALDLIDLKELGLL